MYDPVTFTLADYDTGGPAAVAAGAQYWRVDGDITGSYIENLGDGLYYATGDIVFNSSGVDLDVTLVAEGRVTISGSGQQLRPFLDGLLIFAAQPYSGIDQCDKFVVSLGGSDQNWFGLIYGPSGLIEMSGSTNATLTGSLIGYSVRLNGSSITIIADPDLFPAEPIMKLIQ